MRSIILIIILFVGWLGVVSAGYPELPGCQKPIHMAWCDIPLPTPTPSPPMAGEIPAPYIAPMPFFGYMFCGSGGDVCRFRHFNYQMVDEDLLNDARALYYMDVIAWDYGLSPEQFMLKWQIEPWWNIETVEISQDASVEYST